MTRSILNVEQSLNSARWVMPAIDDAAVARLSRDHDLPDMVAKLLSGRGITGDDVEAFLHPRLKDLADPFSLTGMSDLADYLVDAIKAGRKIGVFGDFDVDGATSTSLLVRFFRHLGIDAPFYIPDRLKEGYGPNVNALQNLKEQGAEIVLICDCGITSFDVIEQGNELGLELVVLDHHEAEDKLPAAKHVVNPKRKDDESGLDMLAAVGVVFMVCVALNARLRDAKFYEERGIAPAPLKDWLDIVALGTVCDMVPLTGVNRLIVRYGLQRMAQRENVGLAALMEVAGVKGDPSTYSCGFALGPRINAGSRVHKAYLGAQLLASDDAEEAKDIAWTLNDCNDKRKDIQAEMMEQAAAMVEREGLADAPVIIVGDESWHPGLSGLVAGNLKERYGKPAICITYAPGDEFSMEGRGSGRSIPGVNLGAAFIDARNAGFLVKGGGHAMAAGFTVLPEKVEAFTAFMKDHIQRQLDGQTPAVDWQVDGVLSVNGARLEVVKMIEAQVGPFGQGFEEPVFVLPNVRLHFVDIVGADHIRCTISDWEGGQRMKAVAFRAKDTPMGDALLRHGSTQAFHLAGYFKINEWQGRESVEMHIQDAALVMTQENAAFGNVAQR
jgi:single-stranded-DNA-specific exonuclease